MFKYFVQISRGVARGVGGVTPLTLGDLVHCLSSVHDCMLYHEVVKEC